MTARQTASPSSPSKEHQVAVRIPSELLRLIDGETERLRVERPGMDVRRSDTIREVLYRALRPRGGDGSRRSTASTPSVDRPHDRAAATWVASE